MGSLSPIHLLILLVIVVLIFGTKKLKNIGHDLGSAVKGFKEGMRDSNEEDKPVELPRETGRTIEGEAKKETKV